MKIRINGIRLYYEKTGDGPPLVMVHCNSMDHRIFRTAVRVLAQRFTVYCPDSRDHGKSEKVKTLHYEDMAEDLYAFITTLGLERPAYYGFSDGGIIGLLLAARRPDLLSALIVSGASLRPDSTKDLPLRFFKLWSHVDRSDKMRIMLREPDITDEMLRSIRVPTFVTAGERDVIKEAHTRHIAETIPGAQLKIFPHTGHTGYIMRSRKIADYILSVLPPQGESDDPA
ncbi:MAG: alpha/beta hydrolase [Clostridia bacterium]|nr:alpha/beta hydrolase [Clostridia bacterium]